MSAPSRTSAPTPVLIRTATDFRSSSGRCAPSRHPAEGHPQVLIIAPATDQPTIAQLRLATQGLVGGAARFGSVAEACRAIGPVQAQDYNQLVWALGCRLPGSTAESIEAELSERSVLRSWSMRGTIHLVPAEDAEWMRRLFAPKILARTTAKVWEYHAVTHQIADRAAALFTDALSGSRTLRRDEMIDLLAQNGIPDDRQQSYFLFSHLCLQGLLCVGPNSAGKQTFALREEWAPEQRELDHDQSLGELASRFFTSHGPVTVADFANWAGLAAAEAATGHDQVRDSLTALHHDDEVYWAPNEVTSRPGEAALLSGYDEFHIGLKDRSAIFARHGEVRIATHNGMFFPIATLDGQVAGTWKRTVQKRRVLVDLRLVPGVDPEQFDGPIQRIGEFYQLPTVTRTGVAPAMGREKASWNGSPRS